jgi:hypothetical protein
VSRAARRLAPPTPGTPAGQVWIIDGAAYGLIVVQGQGVFGGHRIGAPTMIRFGEKAFQVTALANPPASNWV